MKNFYNLFFIDKLFLSLGFSLSVPLLFIYFIVLNKSQLYKDFLAMTFFSAGFSSFASSFMFLRGSAFRKCTMNFSWTEKNKPDWFSRSSHETWNPIILFFRKQFHEQTNWSLDKSPGTRCFEKFSRTLQFCFLAISVNLISANLSKSW